jgi:hypothetical protein
MDGRARGAFRMSRTPLALIVGVVFGLWVGWMACFVESKAASGTQVCVSDGAPVVVNVQRGYLAHRGGQRESPGVMTYWAELDVREWRVRLPVVAK